jgi:hypothetical protein
MRGVQTPLAQVNPLAQLAGLAHVFEVDGQPAKRRAANTKQMKIKSCFIPGNGIGTFKIGCSPADLEKTRARFAHSVGRLCEIRIFSHPKSLRSRFLTSNNPPVL